MVILIGFNENQITSETVLIAYDADWRKGYQLSVKYQQGGEPSLDRALIYDLPTEDAMMLLEQVPQVDTPKVFAPEQIALFAAGGKLSSMVNFEQTRISSKVGEMALGEGSRV